MFLIKTEVLKQKSENKTKKPKPTFLAEVNTRTF